MKKILFLSLFLFLVLISCGTTKSVDSTANLQKELKEKNRGNIPLLIQIRNMPGVTISNGVPVFIKTSNTISGAVGIEPLYILNDYIIGNSFKSVNQLVDNFNVKEIQALTGPEASFYGSRAGNGVIIIKTYE